MKVDELFGIVAERMRTDLKATRAALSHPGLRGASFEESFRGFLRSYLPQGLDISTGILVDARGRHSRQLDVIISDAAKTPVLYSVGNTRVIPVECAYMVIEVKAHLDTPTLRACMENMLSVRSLEKTAYFRSNNIIKEVLRAYGQEWEIYPVNYFVFGFDSIELTTLGNVLVEECRSLPATQQIDSICVLDKGVICNQTVDGMIDALPQPGAKRFLCATPDALLLFYTLLSQYFAQAWIPNFRFKDYLGEMSFGPIPQRAEEAESQPDP